MLIITFSNLEVTEKFDKRYFDEVVGIKVVEVGSREDSKREGRKNI